MGRAGLAVPYDWIHSGKLNPAVYGLVSGNLRFESPGLAARLQGVSLSDVFDFSGSIGSGGFDPNDLSLIARRLGDENSQFGLGLRWGLFAGGLAVDAAGDGLASTVPNTDLQNWVAGGAQGNPPGAAQLDAYGLGGYQFSAAYGRRLNTPGALDLSVGVRVKLVRSYYSHHFVTGTQISNGQPGSPAPEMGGSSVLSKNGVGIDLGLIASAAKDQGLFYGMTIENLVEPNTSFNGTFPNGVPGLNQVKPYVRTFNFGIGYMTKENFVLAADWYDATNNAGSSEFRFGAEWLVSKGIFLRAGYESLSGGTFGVGVAGINLAFGGNSIGNLSYAVKF